MILGCPALSISLSRVSRSRSVRVYLQDYEDQGHGQKAQQPVMILGWLAVGSTLYLESLGLGRSVFIWPPRVASGYLLRR